MTYNPLISNSKQKECLNVILRTVQRRDTRCETKTQAKPIWRIASLVTRFDFYEHAPGRNNLATDVDHVQNPKPLLVHNPKQMVLFEGDEPREWSTR